jgi:MSHA pilin protein MshC
VARPAAGAALIHARGSGGFTAVELVVVIVVLGVLAAVAFPRLVGRTGFESRAFADEVASALRYGQRSAIAMRRPVVVEVNSGTSSSGAPCALRLCLDSGCTQFVVNPADNQPFCLAAPSLIAVARTGGSQPFSFGASGRPSSGANYTISSSAPGDASRVITVEAESGYVH